MTPLLSVLKARPRRARGGRSRLALVLGFAFVAMAVFAFSAGWRNGGLTLDGPGVSMYVRMALEHWREGGSGYWVPEMWSGTPLWALAPSFPVFVLLPLAAAIGPENAVKLASLLAQVAGGWGTIVLARALLGRRGAAPVLAGLVYALHPLFISHAALFGHETSVWVMGATPWLVHTFRLALKGGGSRYLAYSGLLAAFAVLQQAEHAYGLVIMCACMLAVEMARGRLAGPGLFSPGAVLLRAGVAATIGLGAIAYWLVPFLALSKSFVFTPPEAVRSALVDGIGGTLGRHPEAWVTRSPGLEGTVPFNSLTSVFGKLGGVGTGSFYLGLLCLVLTVVTIVLITRHDHDAHLSAVLFAGVIGLWLSSGGVPLADSGLARSGMVLPFAIVGVVAGALVGGFLRQLHLGRIAVLAGSATGALLVTLPYAAPFLALQRVVPFLDTIRFPRFYPIAILGIALGTAYPITVAESWFARRQARVAPLFSAALCLAVAGVFLVDVHPYRSYYRVDRPDGEAAYARALDTLRPGIDQSRVAVPSFGDPALVSALRDGGQQLSVGWPHPVAGREVWTVTGEALFALPVGYRNAALGLSGTAWLASERLTRRDGAGRVEVAEVELEPNPQAMPLVRAYEQTMVVSDPRLASVMAVALARRNIAVVTGDGAVARRLGANTGPVVAGSDLCGQDRLSVDRAGGAETAGEVATACALDRWVGGFGNSALVSVDARPGALFRSPVENLQGVSIALDRDPGRTQLVLREVAEDGRSLGREVAAARASGTDRFGMAAFEFDPVPGSAGRHYAFELSCPTCGPDDYPKMGRFESDRPGNLVVGGRVQPGLQAAFSLLYDEVPAAPPAATTLSAIRPAAGHWRVTASGPNEALVVVADAWFPGWKAEVDGRPVPVVKADGAFLGVKVPPGRHRVDLVYHRPAAATVGRMVTVLTLVAAAVFVVLPPVLRRSRRKRRPPLTPQPTAV